jgi:hypothetical protein
MKSRGRGNPSGFFSTAGAAFGGGLGLAGGSFLGFIASAFSRGGPDTTTSDMIVYGLMGCLMGGGLGSLLGGGVDFVASDKPRKALALVGAAAQHSTQAAQTVLKTSRYGQAALGFAVVAGSVAIGYAARGFFSNDNKNNKTPPHDASASSAPSTGLRSVGR